MLWNVNECGEKKIMTVSRQKFPVKLMIDKNNWRMWNILNI
jgi:hypothetical protein